MDDPYALQHFVDAQNPIFEHVLAELRAGYKQRHSGQLQWRGTTAFQRLQKRRRIWRIRCSGRD